MKYAKALIKVTKQGRVRDLAPAEGTQTLTSAFYLRLSYFYVFPNKCLNLSLRQYSTIQAFLNGAFGPEI